MHLSQLCQGDTLTLSAEASVQNAAELMRTQHVGALALTDPDHPLALDTTSPLHTDFTPDVWNQIYRSTPSIKKAKAMA